MTANESNEFNKFFNHKSLIGPICEKACKNFKINTEIDVDNQQIKDERLFFFAIGHTFKNIDIKSIFEIEYSETTKTDVPTQFLNIQKEKASFWNLLYKNEKGILVDIRNINSHYIHDFSRLKLDYIKRQDNGHQFIDFLKESFLLSVIVQYCEEKKINHETFIKNNDYHKLTQFLQEKFFPLKNEKEEDQLKKEAQINESNFKRWESYLKYKDRTLQFKILNFKEAINELLFIKVDLSFVYQINKENIFEIEQGSYLSYNACLFITTMFLYKDEANRLISKIKGFKRNKGEDEKSKLKIFTFFAKKYSSQDINNEEKNLTTFRDIIQYLNKYPTAWKKEMEFASLNTEDNSKKSLNNMPKEEAGIHFSEMSNSLISYLFESELKKNYPSLFKNEIDHTKRTEILNRFTIFSKNYFGETYFERNNKKKYIKAEFSYKENEQFLYELETPEKIKDIYRKLQELNIRADKYKYIKEINDLNSKIEKYEKDKEENTTTQKLKKRIIDNQFIISNGRNQDRFMEIATLFLAENNYFGKDALFKMYCYQLSTENKLAIEREKQTLTKKEFDKLKFHDGRLVAYQRYDNQTNWTTPFVIENNSIHVKTTLFNGIQIDIPISRNLMIYILENALYDTSTDKIENKGKSLFSSYYSDYTKALSPKLEILKNQSNITEKQKTEFLKFFPKRLLHNYSPAKNTIDETEKNSLYKIIKEANFHENRYKNLQEKAVKEKNIEDFNKRNKGKQFKLRFIKKAWNLMYFREIYKTQLENAGKHHKQFHITREEFNDFSRFLFAFDLNHYKENLKELLDKKSFFENVEFKKLFTISNTFEELYYETKKLFEKWLNENGTITKKNAFKLESYLYLNEKEEKHPFVINLSQFLTHLKDKNKIQFINNKYIYKSIENSEYLISSFYYKDVLPYEEQKKNKYLFNKLRKTKLEDALLYEIAFRYLNKKQNIQQSIKTNVSEILTKNFTIDLYESEKENTNLLYKVVIPFKQLDTFERMLTHKKNQENLNSGDSFLKNIKIYIVDVLAKEIQTKTNNSLHKDVSTIVNIFKNGEQKENREKETLSFDELKKIEAHLLSTSNQFSKILMEIECYYTFKMNSEGTNILEKYKEEYNNSNTEDAFHIKFNTFKKDITDVYLTEDNKIRDKVFHYGVPLKISYTKSLEKIEERFIKLELPNNKTNLKIIKDYQSIDHDKRKICDAFLTTTKNNLFDYKIKNTNMKRLDAENKYFNQYIISKL